MYTLFWKPPDSLLSFTNFVQVEQSPDLERRTVLSNEPRQYATRGHPWRIAKCLDSLANVCVAERHEVLATALRYGNVKNRKTLEIIIAGHDDVSGRTISHLEQIWGLLRRISETARQKTRHNSPAHIQDRKFGLSTEFETTVLKFTYHTFHYKLFKNIDMFKFNGMPIGDQEKIEGIKKAVYYLENVLRQDDKKKKTSISHN